jgi:hypothetical protein
MAAALKTSLSMEGNRQLARASAKLVDTQVGKPDGATTQRADRPCGCPAADATAPGAADEKALFSRQITRLVRDHRTHLVRLARQEGLSAEDAFDAVQEAFSAFLLMPQSRALADAPEEAGRFLSAITRNVARNARRLHATARPHVTEPAVVEGLPDRGERRSP